MNNTSVNKKILFILGLLLCCNAQSEEIGFDPGLKTALVSSLFPYKNRYFESCPDSPTQRCFGTIPKSGGFYTLPIDYESDEYWNMVGVSFKDTFNWRRDELGNLIAELKIDSRELPSPSTPNLYTRSSIKYSCFKLLRWF